MGDGKKEGVLGVVVDKCNGEVGWQGRRLVNLGCVWN